MARGLQRPSELTFTQTAALIAKLETRDIEILSMVAMGYSDARIAAELSSAAPTIKQRLNRDIKPRLGLEGRGRGVVGLFYTNNILMLDTTGKPHDPARPAYTGAGQKLIDWTVWAKEIREKLREAGLLTPRRIELAMLLTDPDNVDSSKNQLAALLGGPKEVTGHAVHTHLNALTGAIGSGGKTLLAVVATLAPFDEGDA